MRKTDKYALTRDGGGVSRGTSGETSAIAFYAVQPHRLLVLKAASNVFVAEEQALGGIGPNGALRGFKIACTRIEVRPTGPSVADRGAKLLTTPAFNGFIPPRLSEAVAAECIASLPRHIRLHGSPTE